MIKYDEMLLVIQIFYGRVGRCILFSSRVWLPSQNATCSAHEALLLYHLPSAVVGKQLRKVIGFINRSRLVRVPFVTVYGGYRFSSLL